jgi:hypothetical protein
MSYRNKYHRDGSVTVWNVYTQSWVTDTARGWLENAKIMSTLSRNERARIEALAEGVTLAVNKRYARKIMKAADDGGTIQADAMIEFTDDPCMHTTMSLSDALKYFGCEYAADLID